MSLQCIKKLVKSATYPITLSESSCYQAKMLLVQFWDSNMGSEVCTTWHRKEERKADIFEFWGVQGKNQTNKQTNKQNKTIFNKMTWALGHLFRPTLSCKLTALTSQSLFPCPRSTTWKWQFLNEAVIFFAFYNFETHKE